MNGEDGDQCREAMDIEMSIFQKAATCYLMSGSQVPKVANILILTWVTSSRDIQKRAHQECKQQVAMVY